MSESTRLGVQTKTQFYCVEWASIAIYSERVREYNLQCNPKNNKTHRTSRARINKCYHKEI